jgi:hypothetical protein
MRALSALALLVSGCAANGGAPAQPVFSVQHTAVYSSSWDWQGSPWYRSSDLASTGPFYVVVADGNRACVVTAADWMRASRGALYSCPAGWRAPRVAQGLR